MGIYKNVDDYYYVINEMKTLITDIGKKNSDKGKACIFKNHFFYFSIFLAFSSLDVKSFKLV